MTQATAAFTAPLTPPPTISDAAAGQPEIKARAEHVDFFYGSTQALHDISLDFPEHAVTALIGPSGCGKTTTGRTIIRLYQPTSGEIWFNGKRIDGKLNAEETRQVTSKMQMVFQDPVASLNPRMTVEEIICEGVKINKLYPDKTERRNQVYKMLDMVGLTREHATRYPHEFSGGQRQRICIARALITQPDLLIADEPISALDVSIQAQILNILNDLRKELGLTILFIAHDLSVVKYFSNRVAVMNAGRSMRIPSRCFPLSLFRIRSWRKSVSVSIMTRQAAFISPKTIRFFAKSSRGILC